MRRKELRSSPEKPERCADIIQMLTSGLCLKRWAEVSRQGRDPVTSAASPVRSDHSLQTVFVPISFQPPTRISHGLKEALIICVGMTVSYKHPVCEDALIISRSSNPAQRPAIFFSHKQWPQVTAHTEHCSGKEPCGQVEVRIKKKAS